MKKLATLLLAAGLVFGATASVANAINFKIKGEWIMTFEYGQNGNLTGGHGQTGYNGSEDEFNAKHRIRLQLEAVASENLSGVVQFEIGNTTWGKSSQGGALGSDETNVEVRRAYIDWTVPNTALKVRMGIQTVNIPSYTMTKSQVLTDEMAGITLSYQFNDNVAATAFWYRLYNDNFAGSSNKYANEKVGSCFMDNVDLFGLLIPMNFDGFRVTPWGMIAAIGPNAFGKDNGDDYDTFDNFVGTSKNELANGLLPAWGVTGTGRPDGSVNDADLRQYATAWWAGLTADITHFDPFRIAFDFMGGAVQWDDSRLNRAGWLATLLVEYKTDWGIPGLVAWYGSGDNSNLGDGSERLPYVSLSVGTNDFSYFAYDGRQYPERKIILGTSMAGTWGIGLRVKNVSFVDKLTHAVRVNLIGGTNDHRICKQLAKTGNIGRFTPNNNRGFGFQTMYLTDQDTALDLNLHTEFKPYENFTILMDASYLALWLADTKYGGMRRQMSGSNSSETRDAWNFAVTFAYSF